MPARTGDAFFTICYEQVLKDILHIEKVRWDLIVLDEGQRIKNWEAKTSRVIRGLTSARAASEDRLAATGAKRVVTDQRGERRVSLALPPREAIEALLRGALGLLSSLPADDVAANVQRAPGGTARAFE